MYKLIASFTKKTSYLLFIFLFATLTSKAQGDFSELIKSGPEDATKLANAYLNPLFKGLGFGANSGWYNSAKAKNLGKFDIRFVGTAALVPQEDQSFDITKIGLSTKTKIKGSGSGLTPTAFGKENANRPTVEVLDNNGRTVAEFKMPGVAGISFVPSPQIQATMGLIKNTDVALRYSPAIGNDNFGRLQVLGFGVKHEITPWLLPGKSEKIIPVDIAVAFGYNQTEYNLAIKQEDQIDDSNSGRNLRQRIEGKFTGYTFDAILSKKLAVFTPFVSVCYHSSKTKIGALGEYIVTSGATLTGTRTYTTLTDPVNIEKKAISELRGNIGFSLHLAFFRLYGAYSVGDYQAITGGIGFGIGK